MNLLCTHPGRHGDLLWALPTIRALAEKYGEPATLLISAKYGSDGFLDLLNQQPYLAAIRATDWQIEESAPIHPRIPPTLPPADRIFHLGYTGWPSQSLPHETALIAYRQLVDYGETRFDIDLDRPWITHREQGRGQEIAIGFSDEYFELKYGLCELLDLQWATDMQWDVCDHCGQDRPSDQLAYWPSARPGSRWETEARCRPASWIEAAQTIAQAQVFLGCNSALHVLAVGLGKPCVIMEPNPQRWNDIFWPLGKTGRVRLVLGGDGLPTFDARHTADTLREVLRGSTLPTA